MIDNGGASGYKLIKTNSQININIVVSQKSFKQVYKFYFGLKRLSLKYVTTNLFPKFVNSQLKI